MTSDAAIRVLLVDDDDVDALYVCRALERSCFDFLVHRVDCLSAAARVLCTMKFDVVVLDIALPDGFGLENLTTVQEVAPRTPVVILAGSDDEQIALELVRNGAQDFLSKNNLDEHLIVKSLTYAMQRKSTEVRLREGVCELQQAAQIDPLTGLLNRRAFVAQAGLLCSHAQAVARTFGCVMLNIDFFKRINDVYGCAAGDEALAAVANVLRKLSRSGDLVGRYGGQVFCIMLSDVDEAGAMLWAERVRLVLRDTLVTTERSTLTMTASLGVAEGPGANDLVETVFDQADQALLISKQRGGNLVTSFAAIDESGEGQVLAAAPPSDYKSAVIRDYMTSPIRCLRDSDTLAVAAEQLLALRVNSLPVVDEEDQLVGIVSEKDLIEVDPSDLNWAEPIRSVMNTTVVSFGEEALLQTARDFLARVALRRVVVVNDGRPVGVLSRSNLLRHQLKWAASLAATVEIEERGNEGKGGMKEEGE